ncbi:MFS transporter [Acuticoccus sp. M5D2P5]|uniref:MFS transporter n=1 Tax=Acuticoccus kalidii TaxID=2910977 RepID=UPI001F3476FE|nr:MFS transporter [Acuticoccus kalidii]MCF3935249.1 MFS transporter [Acuticoccus kalidii]
MAASRGYARLFQSKLLTLVATGVTTVAFSILAFDIAGRDASALLGTALAIKALASIVAPPLVAAVVERFSRGRLLVLIDVLRGLAVLGLAFVASEWLLVVLVAVFLAASAAFKLTYHEYVAYLLPAEGDYARALSKSQIVDELESAASPLLAAGLLLLLPLGGVLVLTMAAFAISAARISSAGLPDLSHAKTASPVSRSLAGIRLLVTEPRFRALPYLAFVMAAGTAMVMTTTPVIVQGVLGLGARATAVAFAGFGSGAVVGALLWVWLARRHGERALMMTGAALVALGLFGGIVAASYPAFIVLWIMIGAGVMLIHTPAAFAIGRNVGAASLQVAFGAGLALQNAALLVVYLLAGWLTAATSLDTTFLVLGLVAGAASLLAFRVRPTAPAIG